MIDEKIKSIMAKVFGLSSGEISAESSNETIERWDSLGHMNLCLALEEEFGIELDGDSVASMSTYSDVVKVVAALVNDKS